MLIECPECNKKISDEAKKCPKCGYDVEEDNNRRSIKLRIVYIVIVFGFFALWTSIFEELDLINHRNKTKFLLYSTLLALASAFSLFYYIHKKYKNTYWYSFIYAERNQEKAPSKEDTKQKEVQEQNGEQ